MDIQTQALTAADLQAGLAYSPFLAFMDMTVLRVDAAAQEVEVKLEMKPEFERLAGTGQWHGGPLAALVDTVGDLVVVLLQKKPIPTINFRIDYLKPATGSTLRAIGKLRRVGRTVAVADVDVLDSAGAVVAVGRGAYGTSS
jgi:uncharacterized protein (TIGR00369 family)